MKHTIDELLDNLNLELASPANLGYLHRPIPCELDNKITAMLDLYKSGSLGTRLEIAAKISSKQTWGLLAYAERMAILSVRAKSRKFLENALLALVIEGFRVDVRENILMLSLINNSAIKIGVDAKQLFESAIGNVEPEIAQRIREFIGRPIENKSIQSMGYSEAMTSDGFSYVRNW